MNDIQSIINSAAEPDALQNLDQYGDIQINDAIDVVETAIESQPDDPGAPFQDEVIDALRLLQDKDRPNYQRLRARLKTAKVPITALEKLINQNNAGEDESSGADDLVNLVIDEIELFHDESNVACASIDIDGHRETYPIYSERFSEWLAMTSYRRSQKTPSEHVIKNALLGLSGRAKFDGEERKLHLRVGNHNNGYVIDLGDPDWQAVVVTSQGWNLTQDAPIRFWRSRTMRPLPVPISGDYNRLWRYLNIPESDRILVLAFIFECWRNDTNFPILELIGEQGSAKSTTQEILRALIDPNEVPLRAAQKNREDLFVSAASNWLASYNNLSRLPSTMQDDFCTLATGGGFATRTLYTNTDETVIDVSRPVIINGISTLATAQDMLDRVIRVELPTIQSYRTDSEMRAEFEKDKPYIFGGLLDLFANTLSKLPEVENQQINDRMADFVLLGEAMLRAMGKSTSFERIFKAKKQEAITYALESSPVINALIEYANENPADPYSGTVKELYEALCIKKPDHSDGWPKSPKGLSDLLRRNAPALRAIGIGIESDKRRRNDGYHIKVYFLPTDKAVNIRSQSTQSSRQTEVCEHGEHGERKNSSFEKFEEKDSIREVATI